MMNPTIATGLRTYALRLSPGEDLKECLQTFVNEHAIAAGGVLTTVGSLQQASLRFAGQEQTRIMRDRFEILSLVGTLSLEGLHLHMAISDCDGQTWGGHVMPGCIIYTTAEIIVGALTGIVFQRSMDGQTGYRELVVIPQQGERR
jgi:predicted DNA-binding protein with PD1-like motif